MLHDSIAPNAPLDRKRLVYRWDLDKTYLRTDFDTLKDLWRRAVERPADKRTVPGAAPLLRELRATGPAGIFILSGSPEQMRRVLEAKLRLDGITWDELTLKPSLRQLLRGRFGFLKDQVGFKLSAMLTSREPLAPELDEVLFGDDAETDAFVYSLYADLCAGRVGQSTLLAVLEHSALSSEEIVQLLARLGRLPKRSCCRRIFIHLERVSPLDGFAPYGRRVCPFYNYFQPAVVLLEAGAIDAAAALRVAAELVLDQGFTPDALVASYRELAGRGQVVGVARERLLTALDGMSPHELATATPALRAFGKELARASVPEFQPRPVPVIDYAGLLETERQRARVAKLRVRSRF